MTVLHSDSPNNWLHVGLLIINLCQRVTNLISYVEVARRICTDDKYLNFTLNMEEKEKREDQHTTRSISPGPVMVVTDTLQWCDVVTGSVFHTGFIQTAVSAFNSNFQSCLTPKPHYTLSLRCNKNIMSVWKRQNNNRSWWGSRRSAWDQSKCHKQAGRQQTKLKGLVFLAWVWCRKYCALVCIDVLQACTWFRIHIYAVFIRDKNKQTPPKTNNNKKHLKNTNKISKKQQRVHFTSRVNGPVSIFLLCNCYIIHSGRPAVGDHFVV